LFTLDFPDGADLGVAAGDGVRRDVAFRAGAFRALAFAVLEGAALREVFTVLRGAAVAVRRTLARAVFLAFFVRVLTAFRDADRPRLTPRRALVLFRRAALRLAIAPCPFPVGGCTLPLTVSDATLTVSDKLPKMCCLSAKDDARQREWVASCPVNLGPRLNALHFPNAVITRGAGPRKINKPASPWSARSKPALAAGERICVSAGYC
jgi:hypothetical protein